MQQQPQAMEEIQDENQEGKLRTETKYNEDVPLKKVNYTSQCLTVNKKEMLKHLSYFRSVFLIGIKEKVRQTCGKLQKQYNKYIVLLNVDKESCVIILSKIDYIDKVNEMIQDGIYY